MVLVSLGEEGPEVVSYDNLIYINSGHPSYQKLSLRKDQFEIHLLRLITQEIAFMKRLRLSAKETFKWQSKLLTDSFCGKQAHKKRGE